MVIVHGHHFHRCIVLSMQLGWGAYENVTLKYFAQRSMPYAEWFRQFPAFTHYWTVRMLSPFLFLRTISMPPLCSFFLHSPTSLPSHAPFVPFCLSSLRLPSLLPRALSCFLSETPLPVDLSSCQVVSTCSFPLCCRARRVQACHRSCFRSHGPQAGPMCLFSLCATPICT